MEASSYHLCRFQGVTVLQLSCVGLLGLGVGWPCKTDQGACEFELP
jgi:hypothetical protein